MIAHFLICDIYRKPLPINLGADYSPPLKMDFEDGRSRFIPILPSSMSLPIRPPLNFLEAVPAARVCEEITPWMRAALSGPDDYSLVAWPDGVACAMDKTSSLHEVTYGYALARDVMERYIEVANKITDGQSLS